MQRVAWVGQGRGPARFISSSRRAWRCRALGLLSFIALSATVGLGAETIVFGPQTYTRGTGKPVAVRKTFRISSPSDKYTLRVVNHGVTSAVISLNGRTILEPKDFTLKRGRAWRDDEWVRHTGGRDDDHHGGGDSDRRDRDGRDRDGRGRDDRDDHDDEFPVPFLAREVRLRAGTNQIVVELRGVPRTSLTVEIVGSPPLDDVPPVITSSVAPPPNSNGWNNGSVTATFACSDAGSGVATCPAPVTVSTEGANQVVSGTAVDKAGNTATASVTLNIDKAPPVVTASAAPAANANEWNNGPVVVTFGAIDALSGVAPGSVTPPVTLMADGANLSASGQAIDLAGNVGSVMRAPINIDQVAPTATAALLPAPNSSGWNNTPVVAHYTCSDTGSGIAKCSRGR